MNIFNFWRQMSRTQREGMGFILLASTGYSFFPVFAKNILATGMPPLDIALVRFAFAMCIVWLFIAARRLPAPAKPMPRLHVLLMGTFLAAAAGLAFFGLQFVTAGTYAVLFYTYPAMVALLSILTGSVGERLDGSVLMALALTMLGVALIVPGFDPVSSPDAHYGVILALINALVVAVYFMISSRLLRNYNTPSALARGTAYGITGAFMVLLVLGLLRGVKLPNEPITWFNLTLMAAFSTAMPVFALNTGIQKLGPTRSAIVGTFEPLFTAIVAFIFLGEIMQPIQWLGGALILVSVIMFQMRQVRAAEPVTGD